MVRRPGPVDPSRSALKAFAIAAPDLVAGGANPAEAQPLKGAHNLSQLVIYSPVLSIDGG